MSVDEIKTAFNYVYCYSRNSVIRSWDVRGGWLNTLRFFSSKYYFIEAYHTNLFFFFKDVKDLCTIFTCTYLVVYCYIFYLLLFYVTHQDNVICNLACKRHLFFS